MNSKQKLKNLPIIHLLLGDYSIDSRVRNQTEALSSQFNIKIICYGPNGETSQIKRNKIKKIELIQFCKGTNILRFIKTWIMMIIEAKSLKPSLIHAHDAKSLPIAFIIAKLTNSKVIYDSHELWSQSHHKNRPLIFIQLAERLERFLGQKANCIITVSDSIAKYLRQYLPHDDVHVVRNIPTYMNLENCGEFTRNSIRKKWGATEKHLVLMYQGLMKSERGIFVIAKALKLLQPKSKFLMVFLGSGPDKHSLKKYVADSDLLSFVRFQDSVKMDDLACYTRSADVGIHAIQNTCLNHDYCLPNKLFEYLKCEIPVVVTKLTEMTNFVESNGFGSTFEDGDSQDLAKKIHMFRNQKFRETTLTNVINGKSQLSGRSEYSKLSKIYENLLYENYI
jgi:glycosyltransferase involved in cell wall biosynthesis